MRGGGNERGIIILAVADLCDREYSIMALFHGDKDARYELNAITVSL